MTRVHGQLSLFAPALFPQFSGWRPCTATIAKRITCDAGRSSGLFFLLSLFKICPTSRAHAKLDLHHNLLFVFFSFLKRSLSKRDLGISEKKTLRNKRLFHFGGSVCLPHNRTRCNGLRSVSATREVHGFEHWRALLSAPLFSKEILLWKMKRNAIVTFSLGAPKRSHKSMGESLAERRLFFGKRKKKVKVWGIVILTLLSTMK